MTLIPMMRISLPEPLFQYVADRSEEDGVSANDFISELIVADQLRSEYSPSELLFQLLEASAKELDDGKGVEFDVERVIADGRRRRAQQLSRKVRSAAALRHVDH